MPLRGMTKYLLVLLLTPCVSAVTGATFKLLPLLLSGQWRLIHKIACGNATEDDHGCKCASDKIVFFHCMYSPPITENITRGDIEL